MNIRAQMTIEYLLMFAALVLVILFLVARENTVFQQGTRAVYEQTADSIGGIKENLQRTER